MSQATRKPTHHRRLYTLLAVGKRDLAMSEDAYRALLARHGASERQGRISASTMTLASLEAALAELRSKGFKPQPARGSAHRVRDDRIGLIKKITAVWCALADAGVVRSRGEAAMVKWCATHTGVARLQWANKADLVRAVEALKLWAARERVQLED